MLLDCSHISAGAINETMEHLCKSVEDDAIWYPHPTDRLLAAMEDVSTEWVGQALNGIHVLAMQAFGLGGERPCNQTMAKANAGPFEDETRCSVLRKKIIVQGPGSLTLMEYLDVIECWIFKYLPPAMAANKAKRSAIQQYLVGLARRNKSPGTNAGARKIIEALPSTIGGASHEFGINGYDEARIRVAQASAARHITDLTNHTRSAIQSVIIQAEKRRVDSGVTAYDAGTLQQQLSDKFRLLNRDWRRVAITETAINSNDAYVAKTPIGKKLQWLAHEGMCRYCKEQNGKIFTVVAADFPRKDPDTQVWVGKHAMNIGRAISTRKRVEGGGLVERTEDEIIKPVIPAHPHCRCIWITATG